MYNYTDHLGNIRVSYTKFKDFAKTIEETNYYPFGLKHGNYNNIRRKISLKQATNEKTLIPTNVNGYKYKYNGKEWQNEFNLNLYDLGARGHDPARVQFGGIDPRAEEYYSQSPYVFAANNPVFYVDINGEGVEDDYVFDTEGNFVRIDENDKPDQIVIQNQETCEIIERYDFNDPINDVKSIKNGEITGVVIISEDDISNAMWANNTNKMTEKNVGYIDKLRYLYNESYNGGILDHFHSNPYVMNNNLHLVKTTYKTLSSDLKTTSTKTTNIGYNPKDFGNFLWGRAGATLGFNFVTISMPHKPYTRR